MLEARLFRKFLWLCIWIFCVFLAGCSEEKLPGLDALNGTWYLDVEKSFDAIRARDSGKTDDFSAQRLESMRGMMLVFDTKKKSFTIVANEKEREDFVVRSVVQEKDAVLILHLENEQAKLHFRLLDGKNLEFDSKVLGPMIFTPETPSLHQSGVDGLWYIDVEESLMAKPSLRPSEQKMLWLLDGMNLRIDSKNESMIGVKPGSEPREYALHKVSDHVFSSDLDEYGPVILRFFPDGSLKLEDFLPAEPVFSRQKPAEYDLEVLSGTWVSDPVQTRSTHPLAQEGVEAFFMVIDTDSSTIRFLAGEEEQEFPFTFSPEKGKAFRASSTGYEGEILLTLKDSDTLKMLSDNLVVVLKRKR